MDATDRHRFKVLRGLRREYRDLRSAASAVVDAWSKGAYEFLGEGVDPIQGLARVIEGRHGEQRSKEPSA
jgi:hypothetical protein